MPTFYPSSSASLEIKLMAFHALHLGQAQFRLWKASAEVVYLHWQFMHMTGMFSYGSSGASSGMA
jgi:hypothetical protein